MCSYYFFAAAWYIKEINWKPNLASIEMSTFDWPSYGNVVCFALSRIGPTVKQWEETNEFGFQNLFK